MRAHAVALLKIQCMGDQAQHLEAPVVEAEKRADPHIVAAGFHGPA